MNLCDIGNSSYHFLTNDKDFKISVNDNLDSLQFSGILYYISVNDTAEAKLLETFPDAINLKNQFTLNTQYSETLGIDRAVGCFGVNDTIVVDFGSAITVDVIEEHQHMGGFILPGLEKLKACYPEISPKLSFKYKHEIRLDSLPLTTNDAISYAINTMIVNPIHDVQHQYKLPLLITGEHGKEFLDYFTNVEYEQNHIFNMMKLIIQRNNI